MKKRFYTPAIELQMQRHYESLSEGDSRRYAAIEALKLGRGGKVYIINVLGLSSKTLYVGIDEVQGKRAIVGDGRQRKVGGGRKKILPKGTETRGDKD